MSSLWHDLGGVFDQLNPLSRQNQIVYLVWLATYVFTAGAVWRCSRRWLRLVFLLVLQVLSVGLFVSQANILILIIYLWRESLFVGAASILLSVWTFRTRRRREPAPQRDTGERQPASAGGGEGPVTATILAAEKDLALQDGPVLER